MKSALILCLCVLAANADKLPGGKDDDVSIVSYVNEVNGDGTYDIGYELSNGVKASETGRQISLPDDEPGTAVSGSYSFVGDDGKTYTVSYVADENGFQPKADHLPVAPEPPAYVAQLLAKLSQKSR
ncbi:cuticle protein CP14.6-like [Artemia franciscana]|uniref:cuticle protein CP14.6-like n=1 Tax=Artemia franciscana TaxID=6661 RepID=UPI0032DA32B7